MLGMLDLNWCTCGNHAAQVASSVPLTALSYVQKVFLLVAVEAIDALSHSMRYVKSETKYVLLSHAETWLPVDICYLQREDGTIC